MGHQPRDRRKLEKNAQGYNTRCGRNGWSTTFEAQNPGVKIKGEDHGWDEPLRTGLLTAIAGNTAPEATIGEAFVHEFAALGAFNPVIDTKADDFVIGSVLGALIEGKLYGVPAFTSSFALEINKDVIEKSGVDPNIGSQDLERVARSLDQGVRGRRQGQELVRLHRVWPDAHPHLRFGLARHALGQPHRRLDGHRRRLQGHLQRSRKASSPTSCCAACSRPPTQAPR